MKTTPKSMLTKSIITLSTFACISSFAVAESGPYFRIAAGQTTLGHEIHRNTGSNESPSISTRTEETGESVSFALGYEHPINEKAFISIEAFYSVEMAETKNKNNLLVTEVSLESTYGFNVKPGVVITEDFSLYAILGLTVLDFDLDNSYPFAPPMRTASENESGFSYGLGAEYAISDTLTVSAQYSVVKDVSFDPIPEVAVPGKINDNDLDAGSFQLGLTYQF